MQINSVGLQILQQGEAAHDKLVLCNISIIGSCIQDDG